jgi:hypothetical protein
MARALPVKVGAEHRELRKVSGHTLCTYGQHHQFVGDAGASTSQHLLYNPRNGTIENLQSTFASK